MANSAPGVNVSVTAASPNSKGVNPTGTWFVLGTANGPSGVAVPINSTDDLLTYFGAQVNGTTVARYSGVGTNGVVDSTLLFDSLDVFFREGGVNTFVSNVVSSSAVKATSSTGLLSLTAAGGGTWANSASGSTAGVILTVTANSDASAYSAVVKYNNVTLASSPLLGSEADIVAWLNSLPLYKSMMTATVVSSKSTTTTASGTGASTSIALTSVLDWPTSGYATFVSTGASTSVVFSYSGITPGSGNAGTLTGLVRVSGAAAAVIASGAAVTNKALPAASSSVSSYFTSGADVAITDADASTALTFLVDILGPGQVSYPGNNGGTNAVVWKAITDHCKSYNRVAVLDAGTSTASAATLVSNVAKLQTGSYAALDPSYASAFAPWLIVPGMQNVNNTIANTGSFNRTVPPCALAAARMANNDQYNDCNVPAAGVGAGGAAYVVGVSASFSEAERATLNNAGINAIRNLPNVNQIVVYGYRSCAVDSNWVYLNNVRFRMQVKRDMDLIAENFIFDEIDGRGQIFARLNGALAGQCQSYWTRHSIYGLNASDAFQVNTGTLINTPDTIAAGQINAIINLRMAPFGEFVSVNVIKYLPSAALPNYSTQYTL